MLFAASRVWGPFKELLNVVEAAVVRKQPDAVHDLEQELRKHKADFISLLLTPVYAHIQT
jgi:hypothetical protein